MAAAWTAAFVRRRPRNVPTLPTTEPDPMLICRNGPFRDDLTESTSSTRRCRLYEEHTGPPQSAQH